MKKQLTTVLLIFALLLIMAGCSAANAAAHLEAAEERIEDKLDVVEDSVEHAIRQAVTTAPTAAPTQPAPTPADPAPAAPTQTVALTKADAEKIALEYAGFTADQVSRLRTEYEIDDGIPQYDVEFHQGDLEYEFEIHAEDGTILSFDLDHKYD